MAPFGTWATPQAGGFEREKVRGVVVELEVVIAAEQFLAVLRSLNIKVVIVHRASPDRDNLCPRNKQDFFIHRRSQGDDGFASLAFLLDEVECLRDEVAMDRIQDPNLPLCLLDRAFRIAVGDLTGNIHLFEDGLLDAPAACILAGLDYDTPWTRDAAFNTWYGGGLLYPGVARNTLLSVLMRDEQGEIRIGGQYWDAIIWAHGAWQYYLYTADEAFLEIAFPAVQNSLRFFEETEFDPRDGLFRGGACFQDGVSAYPDFFAPPGSKIGGMPEWAKAATDLRAPKGGGIPCKALSTNCLYHRAYAVAGLMAAALGQAPDPAWAASARALRDAINTHFWSPELGRYRFLVDAPGNEDRQEGLGLAFALLFGVADDARADLIFKGVYLSPHGMPCVWPTYPRYEGPGEFGRHSGPIWPQVNAAWALACAARGRPDLAWLELRLLTEKACRDSEFIEVYHPETGLPYGGLQEDGTGGTSHFGILHRQTWCATGYIGMTLFTRLGLEIDDHTPLSAAQRAEILSRLPCCVSESLFVLLRQ